MNSLELLMHVSENSSQKGSVVDSPYLQAHRLLTLTVPFSTQETGSGHWVTTYSVSAGGNPVMD